MCSMQHKSRPFDVSIPTSAGLSAAATEGAPGKLRGQLRAQGLSAAPSAAALALRPRSDRGGANQEVPGRLGGPVRLLLPLQTHRTLQGLCMQQALCSRFNTRSDSIPQGMLCLSTNQIRRSGRDDYAPRPRLLLTRIAVASSSAWNCSSRCCIPCNCMVCRW